VANRFWVGGNATWDATSTAFWSATSGGASGASVPTTSDDVFIDGASGAVTVTMSNSRSCRSLDFTGFIGTFSIPASITFNIGASVAGAGNNALKLVAGMTLSVGSTTTSIINFNSTSATVQTITSAGKTLPCLTFNAVGGSYQLADANTINAASTLTLTAGTLDTNGQTCNWGLFSSSNANTRALTLGASSITITAVGTSWQMSNTTGMTFACGTSSITFTAGSGATMQTGTSQTYYNVTITGSTATIGGSGTGPTFNNYSHTPAAGTINLSVITTPITAALLTLTGTNSGTDAGRVILCPAFVSQTIDVKTVTAAAVSLTNVDFMDITAAGAAAPFTGTSLGDAGGNSNITFTPAVTRYWVGNGGTWRTLAKWAATSGGAGTASFPLPQDNVIFDANSITSATQTINATTVRLLGKNIDMSAMVNNPALSIAGQNVAVCGNLILATGMAVTGSQNLILYGRGAQTLTTNGVSIGCILNITASGGGSYALQDDLSVANTLAIAAGGFNANTKNVTCASVSTSNSNSRTVTMSTGTWTLTGTGVVWNASNTSGYTLSGASATLLITDTSASSKTIEHRSSKIGTVTFTGGGTGVVIFGPSGVYGTINFGAPKTYQCSTTAVTVSAFVAKGTAGNIITFTSSTPGTPAIWNQASGVVNCDYLSLTDSKVQGGATFYAGPNSTNVSGNTGWIFTAANFAITKSLQYAIKKTPAITKSLQYTAKPSISITKSLKYTVKTAPSAITKSLQYAVRVVWGAWQKRPQFVQGTSNTGTSVASLAATLNGVSAGNAIIVGVIIPNSGAAVSSISAAGMTFGRQYVIGDGGTDSAHYYYAETNLATGGSKTITVSFGGTVTKAIIFVREYSNIKTDAGTNPDLTIRVDAAYDNNGGAAGTAANPTIFADNSNLIMSMAVNNNGYSWAGSASREHFATASAGTLSAAVQDGVNDGAGASLGSGFTQGTSGLYFATAISYASATDSSRSPLSKSLQYYVRKPTAITKSLRYTVKSAISATKSLKYTIKATPTAITKSLTYAVKITPAAITKSLRYAIKKTPSITKGLIYKVKPSVAVTKSLKYTVKVAAAITRALQYRVRVVRPVTKSLSYRVVVTRPAITKTLSYSTPPKPGIPVPLSSSGGTDPLSSSDIGVVDLASESTTTIMNQRDY
jgi:hypothetical protein